MIELTVADSRGLAWAQNVVTSYHYLHAPVDSRINPLLRRAADLRLTQGRAGRPRGLQPVDQIAPLSTYEDDQIKKLAGQAWRSRFYRARRASREVQERFV